MGKALIIGDLHLSDKPPSSCTPAYLDDLFDLMYQTVDLAKENNYFAVIQAGDFFHNKVPNRTSHRVLQRAIHLIDEYPCPFYIVPGNHDMSNDRQDSVFESQPLGVLLRTNAYMLDKWGPLGIYGVPWLAEWAEKDGTGSPSLRATLAVENALLGWRSWDKDGPRLLVTHAPFYPPGLELEYEYFPADVFADMMGNEGSVYYGHIHEPHGIYEVNGVKFCNSGALSRGSLHEYNLTRDIVVTEWDEDTGEFSTIPLKYKPADEVFRLQEVAGAKEARINLNGFLSSIGQATIEITSIESVIQHVKTLGLDSGVETIVIDLLEEAVSE